MKKTLSLLVLLGIMIPLSTFAAKCGKNVDFNPDSGVSLESALNDCTPDGAITTKINTPVGGTLGKIGVSVSSDPGDYTIESGVKNRIENLTYQLMIVGGILAVAGIVISAILMTIALGDDKKLGDAKNGLKYSIIGFVCIIIAFPLVNAIVNLIFGIVWN